MTFNRGIEKLIAHNQWVIAITLLIVALFSYGMTRLTISTDFRVYFDPHNPHLVNLNTLENTYGKQDFVAFYIEPKKADIFSAAPLALIQQLTHEAAEIPNSNRVSSLQNFQYITAINDELMIDDLYFEVPTKQAEIDEIKKRALASLSLHHSIINPNGKATAIVVTLNTSDITASAAEIKHTVEYSRALVLKYRARFPEIKILLAGNATFNVSMGEAIRADISTLVLLSIIVLFLVLMILLQDVWGMFAVMLVISFSVLITIGFFGWMNTSLTPVSGFVPTAIMTIAIADCVHILISYYHALNKLDKMSAIIESMRINATPIFITSLTTIIGVLCLNLNESPPYRELGNMIAVGVLSAYLLSMFFLPAILSLLPANAKNKHAFLDPLMPKLATFVIQYKQRLIALFLLIILISSGLIFQNQLTEKWHDYFDEKFEIRQATKAINKNLSGLHSIQYRLNSHRKEGIKQPEFLRQTDQFIQWYLTQPGVVSCKSLIPILKQLNQKLHNDDPEYYRIPKTQESVAQFLLLLEISLPKGAGLDNMINIDYSEILVTFTVKETNSEAIKNLTRRANEWLKNNNHVIKEIQGVGLDIAFAEFMHDNIRSLLQGTVIALFIISALMIISLRSLKLGLISLIPNVIPAIIAYGIWGVTVGYIGNASAVVVCISLGIIVDDTVHFLSKYCRACNEQHLEPNDCIYYAFETVGKALIITSISLIAGFFVVLFSHFTPSRELGLLLMITIALALIIDLLFLPSLLLKLHSPKPHGKK